MASIDPALGPKWPYLLMCRACPFICVATDNENPLCPVCPKCNTDQPNYGLSNWYQTDSKEWTYTYNWDDVVDMLQHLQYPIDVHVLTFYYNQMD